MKNAMLIARNSLIVALIALASGCVIAPREGYREGYYDSNHHRYYHEGGWHDCGEHDDHCR
jgi:hypothetical protein